MSSDHPTRGTRHRLRVAVLASVISVALAGCSTGSETSASDGPGPSTTTSIADAGFTAGSLNPNRLGEPYLGPVTLQLPADCSVAVKEGVTKKGETARLEYRLAFRPDGDQVVVTWEDMRVTHLGGQEVPADMQGEVMFAFSLPPLRVAADGTPVGLANTDEWLRSFEQQVPEVVELAANPAFVATIEESVISKYWSAWFEVWKNWGSFTAPVEDAQIDVDGTPQKIKMSSLGTTPDGSAAFRMEVVQEGESLAASLKGLIADILPGGDALEDSDFAYTSARLTDRVEVVTDPATLRPDSVLFERVFDLSTESETVQGTERRLSVLDWASSSCS